MKLVNVFRTIATIAAEDDSCLKDKIITKVPDGCEFLTGKGDLTKGMEITQWIMNQFEKAEQ